MTGPEHYREAEKLIAGAVDISTSEFAPHITPEQLMPGLAVAQVHATLALAAATAYKAAVDYSGDEDGSLSRGWARVV